MNEGTKIGGLENVSPAELSAEIQAGARFVVFQYCISVLVFSFKRRSEVYFIRSGDSALTKGLPFSLCSLVLGWWGIPWGPIWTISTIATNSAGGQDVTAEVLHALGAPSPAPPDDSLETLRDGLRSRDPARREQCASMLGDLGAEAAVALPDLEALSTDPARVVRTRAKWAIETIERKVRAS